MTVLLPKVIVSGGSGQHASIHGGRAHALHL